MTRQIEIDELDLRYEAFRMRNPRLEGELLCSIRERGVEEPVLGVDTEQARVLLDGFKRLRCARALDLTRLPYESQGDDPAQEIVRLLQPRRGSALTILEQAAFLDELRATQGWSAGEMARQLACSKGWVSMRLDLFKQLRPAVREKLFAGHFPAYAYLYSVRPVMRMNGTLGKDIERFVLTVSGKGLSVRQIDLLCRSCFEGSSELREQILAGHFELVLREGQDGPADAGCSAAEKHLLQELEELRKGMRRVTALGDQTRLKSPAFHSQAGLVAASILTDANAFLATIRRLHARSEQA